MKKIGQTSDQWAELGIYSDLTGRTCIANHSRQHGITSLSCMPTSFDSESLDLPSSLEEPNLPAKTANLTEAQARTWIAILSGKNLSEIAREEKVSRTAIYSRIRGEKGRGGLIDKNFWALLWWLYLRNERL